MADAGQKNKKNIELNKNTFNNNQAIWSGHALRDVKHLVILLTLKYVILLEVNLSKVWFLAVSNSL